jgi:ABC-type multidrug transport system ATPase subunit
MGPSGSGKTSLLNALSGRISLDSGVISVNGKPLTSSTMKRFKSKVAYVTQADVFFTHLTVRDQFAYTAFLRLPEALPKQQKLDEVERIIKLLRLTKVADSKIQMLSGGEKKRVNIGTELLTDPSCLLLDEPTRYVPDGCRNHAYLFYFSLPNNFSFLLVGWILPAP